MRALAVAALLVLALAGCGTGAGTGTGSGTGSGSDDTLDLEGTVTAITASSGGRGYVIELAEGMLPLEVGIGAPPPGTVGVVVEVPDGVEVPGDAAARFDVLSAWTVENDRGLTVVDYLP